MKHTARNSIALAVIKELAPNRRVYAGARNCFNRHGGGYQGAKVAFAYLRHWTPKAVLVRTANFIRKYGLTAEEFKKAVGPQ